MAPEAGQRSKWENYCTVMPNFSKIGWIPFPEASQSWTFTEFSFWCHSGRYYIKTQEGQKMAQDFRALLNLTIQIVYASGRNNCVVCRGQAGMLDSIYFIFRHIEARSFATKFSGRLISSAPPRSEIKSGSEFASERSTLSPSPRVVIRSLSLLQLRLFPDLLTSCNS